MLIASMLIFLLKESEQHPAKTDFMSVFIKWNY